MTYFPTQEEFRSRIGIGASEVAAIVHEDPYRSAYELWQTKTGRLPKPPQTPAMLYGIEMEPRALALYQSQQIEPFVSQVAGVHSKFAFLRGIADGWCAKLNQGVEIKCPSSPRLMRTLRRGVVPKHYLLQTMAMMDIFEVVTWDFFVWQSDADYELAIVSREDPWSDGLSLEEFWYRIALPQVSAMWEQIERNTWFDGERGDAVEPGAWAKAIQCRTEALESLEAAESRKHEAEAELKRMVGPAGSFTGAGWRGGWTCYRPSWKITIETESQKTMEKIGELLGPLSGSEGVRSISRNTLAERMVFRLTEKNSL